MPMSELTKRMTVINTVGSVGYMLLAATWAFFAAIVVALIFDASSKLNPEISMRSVALSTPHEASITITVLSYVLAAAILVVTIAILVTLPYLIGKWGSRLVRWLMRLLHIDITLTQLFLVKGLLATLPLSALIIINVIFLPESVTFATMYIATVAVAVTAIGLFLVQLLLARRLGVSPDKTW